MADYTPNPITVGDISTTLGQAEWQQAFRVDAILASFFGPTMRGEPGSDMPIIRKTVPGGIAGTAIKVPLIRGLRGEGVSGESVLEGNEEKVSSSYQTVTPALYRNGIAVTSLAEWASVISLLTFAKSALAGWAGRKQDRLIFAKIRALTTALYGGDATSRATVGTNDTFGVPEIARMKQKLLRMGARPLRVNADAQGRPIPYFGIIVSTIDQTNLQADTSWKIAHERIAEMAEKNPVFSGALGEWDGMILFPYSELEGQGSPLRPETILDGAMDNSQTSIEVGGDETGIDYTANFPATGTLLIESELITYTGKSVDHFTGCTRATGGTSAVVHADTTVVTLNNLTLQVGFGAEAICEGLGQDVTPKANLRDYENIKGIAVQMIDGYEVTTKVDGTPANLAVMECYGAVA